MKTASLRMLVIFPPALLFVLLLIGNLQAAGLDLLLRPATTKKLLEQSAYMDIARAGNRLIAVGEMGVIAFSDDQGETWNQAEVPTSVTLTAVFFPTAKHGWSVGHDGVVLHSSDGGQHWEKQLDGNLANQMILEATQQLYSDTKKRLAAASEIARSDLETDLEDIGYQLKDAVLAIKEGPSMPFMDVWFKNEQEGLIVGAFGMIFRTEDGGRNWVAMNRAIDNPAGFHYYGLVKTDSCLLLVGEAGSIYRSIDQGRHWEKLLSPYEGSLFGICADPGGDKAIAVGLRGNAVVITDNGERLEHLTTIVPVTLNTCTLTADGSWVMVGLAGQILVQKGGIGEFDPIGIKYPWCMSIAETTGSDLVLAGLRGLKRIDNPLKK